MSSTSQRVCGAAVAVALVAAAVVVDPWGLRPFESLRWAVASGAVLVGVAAARTVTLPRWSLAAWCVLLGALSAATATAADPVTGLVGHPQRHLGLAAWVVFAAATVLGGAARHRAVAWAATAAAVATVGAALVDAAGWDPLGVRYLGGRVGGLVGQPVFLASLCIGLLPVVAAHRELRRWRWPLTVGLVAVVVTTQTRGAVIGLVAMAIVAAPALRRHVASRSGNRRDRDRPVLVAGAAAAIAAVAAVAIGPFGDRLADTAESSRVDEWAIAVRVLADDPLLGVGPEGYRIAVPEHLDAGYVAEHGRDVVVDRAHANVLDVAVSGGVVAGAAFVALLIGVAATTFRLHRRSAGSFAAAAGTGAVGIFAAELVAFPTVATGVPAWILAGVALAAHPAAVERTLALPVRAVTTGLAAVALAAGATDVAADHALQAATDAAAAGRTEAAVDHADRAVDLRGDLIDAHYVAAQVAASGPTILDLDRGLDRVEAGRDRFPDDPALRDLHIELLVERALRSELAGDIAAAVDALEALVAADPTSVVAESGTERLVQACLYRCDNS